MDTLRMTNYIIAVVFFVCYTYQFLYIPVPWLLAKRKAAKACNQCVSHCPQSIKIPQQLRRIDRFVEQLKQGTL